MQNWRVHVVHGFEGSTGLYRGMMVVLVVKHVHLQSHGEEAAVVEAKSTRPRTAKRMGAVNIFPQNGGSIVERLCSEPAFDPPLFGVKDDCGVQYQCSCSYYHL